ncbi:MAG TPA: acyl-CoA thioesterase [Planctomycetota bacterium]|nr:acyl-CoA thioesterase [Planctomycetota bacterium]
MKRIKTRIEPTWDALTLAVPVCFSDVDAMKIVWHGHYLRYCESAREAWCAERGLSYQRMEAIASVAPVVRVQLEYLRPARHGDVLAVRVARVPGSEPSLDLFYEVRGPDGALLAIAETVQVFIDPTGYPFLSPPPPVEAFFAESRRRERANGATA